MKSFVWQGKMKNLNREQSDSAHGRVKLYSFTLIELLVSKTCQICVSLFFPQKKLSDFATNWSKTTPLFLKEKGSARGKENFFSREKKFSFPLASSPFTLIELLVVIAIIAILAAMLMPALAKARDAGKAANCTNKSKQLAFIMQQYVEDNNEFYMCHTMPNPTVTGSGASTSHPWYNSWRGVFRTMYAHILKKPFDCVLVPEKIPWLGTTPNTYLPYTNFCYNGYLCKVKQSKVKRPSSRFMFVENGHYYDTSLRDILNFHPGTSSQAIFTDLHVKALRGMTETNTQANMVISGSLDANASCNTFLQ